jgi:outer membrane protein
MRKTKIAVVLLIVIVFAVGLASAAEQKIGVVDVSRAINESEPGKKTLAELENLKKAKEASVTERIKPIEKLRSELEAKGSVLSKEARKQKEEEYARQARDAQKVVVDAENEIKKKYDELYGANLREVRVIIEQVAKAEKFTIIFDKNESGAMVIDNSVDITDKVIKQYNDSKKK